MNFLQKYGLRHERRIRLFRARVKQRELKSIADRTQQIRRSDILLFSVIRNERQRLPFFLDYYRRLGVDHFFFVNNGSKDGSGKYLAKQPDCSVWQTSASYKRARFGMDWLNGLLTKFGSGHWTVTVDADEFLVYPFADKRTLRALTDWLDACAQRSFGTMLMDMYSKGPMSQAQCAEGSSPFEVLDHFDSGNYTHKRDPRLGNLWIQGGPRQRVFFADEPARAPALNKIPLVKWRRGMVYVSSTHSLLPRGLNRVYDEWGGEKPSGVLLHAKFLANFIDRSREEAARGQQYAGGREYKVYAKQSEAETQFWTPMSERYQDWRQLEELGLISAGGWA